LREKKKMQIKHEVGIEVHDDLPKCCGLNCPQVLTFRFGTEYQCKLFGALEIREIGLLRHNKCRELTKGD
jgi:hypothetical protein